MGDENEVEYFIFPQIPAEVREDEYEKYFKEIKDRILAQVFPIVSTYIWQNDSFLVDVPKDNDKDYFAGNTKFGDNIEDEWLIVYLLFELSRQNEGLVAKVWDNDGEFLLIEASNNLPEWLQSDDKAKNRVYIFKGNLHIISKSEYPVVNSPSEGVFIVRQNPLKTRASEEIQKDILHRIQAFPKKISTLLHTCHCYVPAFLGKLLDYKPQLISSIVDSFWNRDAIDMKKCATLKYFRPGTRVKRAIKMNKCMYAQLLHQNFRPDKRSGWDLPDPSSKTYKSCDLGVKLAYGAEILCSKAKTSNTTKVMTVTEGDKRWEKFKDSLRKFGYFKDEDTSTETKLNLERQAQNFYLDMVRQEDNQNRNNMATIGEEIIGLYDCLNFDIESMRKEETNILPEDDDTWLNLTPNKLDEMLAETSGTKKAEDFKINNLPFALKQFLDKKGDIDGAEIPDGDIDFQPTEFMKSLKDMDAIGKQDDNFLSDSSNSMDEYGEFSSEDEMETQAAKSKKKSQTKTDKRLEEIMAMMDEELAPTNVGKSFVKVGEEDEITGGQKEGKESKRSDNLPEVDIDLNVVKNLLESYVSQDGGAGPTSNILGSMNIRLPDPQKE
ncbi:DgyrCDS12038 [Dimorphilus gyrociliatus]|uniref:DgyrCDS12038 n=1 Tax=Dimorphilus gyrociliatus TaxID=2664684 RepID=A0A7I8W588_9ANNE|nr:DgyrCDS12038 [Dimorphilus gyrociliatus]